MVAEAPGDSKYRPCNAAELTQADKEIAISRAKYSSKEWLDAQRYAEISYKRCPSSKAAFYLGAALFQDAKERGPEIKFNPDFARARCLLEEAIDKYSQRPISDEFVREAQTMIVETIKQGATYIEVHAAPGTVHIVKGNKQIDERRSLMEGRPISVCAMPGHYDIEVDGIAGYGKTTRDLEKNQPKEVVEFEPKVPGQTEQTVLTTVGVVGVILTGGGYLLSTSAGAGLAECRENNLHGRKCVNESSLTRVRDSGTGMWVVGAAATVTAFTLPFVLKFPPRYQAPKNPRNPQEAAVRLECGAGLMQVACRGKF